MYPNPQEALPLPPRPNLEQYKKLAKDLARACRSGDPDAFLDWAQQWIESLARTQDAGTGRWMTSKIVELAEFAEGRLSGTCSLSGAQFVIARAQGFLSWPKFVKHLQGLNRASSPVSKFEQAVDAIVTGDARALETLLRKNPGLIRARSTREHRATLLHYISANGVEGYRQRSPKNAARIAEILLNAGAEVDAEAEVYGSRCTPLGLVATSTPPEIAGVQIPLIELLLARGAQIDRPGTAGRTHSLVFACLANGQPRAARLLADRGAPLDLPSAAGVGRLDLVQKLKPAATDAQVTSSLMYASGCGQNAVVEFLLDGGLDIATQDGDGQTALHWAVIGGHLETVKMLLGRKAPLEVRNVYGGTVLGQAVWSAAHGGKPDVYVVVIETLIAAGAKVAERHPPVNAAVDAVLERHGSHSDPEWWWRGEEPVSARRKRGGRAKS